MTILVTILDFTALIVQLIGSGIMYKNSPENKSDGFFIYSSGPDYKTPKKKNEKFKWGFFVLGLGFFLALISLLLKTFIPTYI